MSDALGALSGGDYGTIGGDLSGESSLFGNINPLSAGALALGAGGLGFMLAKGPGQLPGQFVQAEQQVPGLQGQAAQLYGEGQALTAEGTSALAMARRGQLTPEQQASLNQEQQRLTNLARQTYANMGRSPDLDTSYIETQANIGQQLMVDAQAAIQSTIQLGMTELSAGSNLTGQSLSYSNAATNILMQAGQAQIAQDKSYSDSLTSAFTAIGKMFGTMALVL